MKPNNDDQDVASARPSSAWFEAFIGHKPHVLKLIRLLERWEPAPQYVEVPSEVDAESGLDLNGRGRG